jgi:hypothetical protein
MTRTQQDRMIQQAIAKHGSICVCGECATHYDKFTTHEGHILFWFNTKDHSTHLITEELDDE